MTHLIRVNGSVSTVDYIPRTELDYGSLLCWASSEVGRQSQPCVFHLSPARPPAPVSLCSVSHEAMTSVRVSCQSEARDREAVTFLMAVWRTGGEEDILRNLTSISGDWSLDGLEPGQEYGLSVRTKNSAGLSSSYNTTFLTYESELAQSRVHIDSTDPGTGFVITPILGALIGVGVALSFVTVTILIVVCCKVNRSGNRRGKEYRDKGGVICEGESEHLTPDLIPSVVIDEDYSEYAPAPSYAGKTPVCVNNRLSGLREQTSRQHIYTLVRGSSNFTQIFKMSVCELRDKQVFTDQGISGGWPSHHGYTDPQILTK